MTAQTKRTDRLDRNYIIDGAFSSAQFGNSFAAISTAKQYFHDMFLGEKNGDFTDANINRPVDSPNDEPLLKNCQEFLATPSAVGSAEWAVSHRMEEVFSRELQNDPLSFSMWYKNDEFQQAVVEFYRPSTTEDDHSSQTLMESFTRDLDTSSSWQKLEIENFAISNTLLGLEVKVRFINNLTSGSQKSLRYTGIKLNIGRQAQGFSFHERDVVEEFTRVQRYLYKNYDSDTVPGTPSHDHEGSLGFVAYNALTAVGTARFKVEMREIPTITLYGVDGNPGKVHRRLTGDVAATPNEISKSGFTRVDSSSAWSDNDNITFHLVADARL